MASFFNSLPLRIRLLLYLAAMLLLPACLLPSGSLGPATTSGASPAVVLTATPITLLPTQPSLGPSPAPTSLPTVTLPYPTADAALDGLCFDYLRTLAGKTIILDSDADLTALYDQVDKSKLCDGPVIRGSFDFSGQQVVGSVFEDQGCDVTLSHESTTLDDSVQQRIITLRAQLIGDCEYDLLYPVWFAIERPPAPYTTQIVFIK